MCNPTQECIQNGKKTLCAGIMYEFPAGNRAIGMQFVNTEWISMRHRQLLHGTWLGVPVAGAGSPADAGATAAAEAEGLAAFTRVDISKYFDRPSKAVARELGIPWKAFNKHVRSCGIDRWPSRKIQLVDAGAEEVRRDRNLSSAERKVRGVTQLGCTDRYVWYWYGMVTSILVLPQYHCQTPKGPIKCLVPQCQHPPSQVSRRHARECTCAHSPYQ